MFFLLSFLLLFFFPLNLKYTAAKYTVLLSFSSSWRYATNLIDGVPQSSAVGSHQYTYFVFGFEEEKAGGEVEVSLNPHTAGADHDLFVCAGSCSTDADHSDAPSMEHYEYRSIEESGEDSVRISTDTLVCGGANSTSAGGGPTPAPIGIYPFGLPCAAAQISTAAGPSRIKMFRLFSVFCFFFSVFCDTMMHGLVLTCVLLFVISMLCGGR